MGNGGEDSELIVLISPDDHLCVCEENGRAAEWSRCWSNWQDINGIYYAGLPNRDCSQHKAASISRVLSLTGLV